MFGDVFAAADAAAGEKTFGKCKACHKVDGANSTGPHLNGVVNRARGSVEGFGYSDGMKSVTDPWTPEALNAFLAAKHEIDGMLERLATLSADHFETSPDEIHWGHVGTLNHYRAKLREITDSAFKEGEHAE